MSPTHDKRPHKKPVEPRSTPNPYQDMGVNADNRVTLSKEVTLAAINLSKTLGEMTLEQIREARKRYGVKDPYWP